MQVLSLVTVPEFEWENSSEFPIKCICVAVSTRERDQLSIFTEVLERFEVYSVNDKMKTSLQTKRVMEACGPDSEECQELQKSYNHTWGLENQSSLCRYEPRARLEKNLFGVEETWPEGEDREETVPLWESDTDRKSDAHLIKIFLTTSFLSENPNVLTCHNRWRTVEVSSAEKI